MDINDDTIFILKTNIPSVYTNCAVSKVLNNHSQIHQWSIDCEDKDCVLRIISDSLSYEKIIAIITQIGFHCEELI